MLGVVDTKQPVICNNLCWGEGGGGRDGKVEGGRGSKRRGAVCVCVWGGGGGGGGGEGRWGGGEGWIPGSPTALSFEQSY